MPKPPIKPTSSSAPSSERAKAFRDRLDQMELTRWEIVASEETRLKVRSIASDEGLTAGVAAEALLQLGIEAYDALQRPTWVDVQEQGLGEPSIDRAFRPALRAPAPPTPAAAMPAPLADLPVAGTPVVLSAKSLASYTTRSQPGPARSGSTPAPGGAKASAPLQGFFDRAKQRKAPKP